MLFSPFTTFCDLSHQNQVWRKVSCTALWYILAELRDDDSTFDSIVVASSSSTFLHSVLKVVLFLHYIDSSSLRLKMRLPDRLLNLPKNTLIHTSSTHKYLALHEGNFVTSSMLSFNCSVKPVMWFWLLSCQTCCFKIPKQTFPAVKHGRYSTNSIVSALGHN